MNELFLPESSEPIFTEDELETIPDPIESDEFYDTCLFVPNEFFHQAIFVRQLGSGTYGSVNLYRLNNQYYAVKTQQYSRYANHGISTVSLREADSLVRLISVPEIIQILGICIQNPNNLSLLLEPLWGTLTDFIYKVPYYIKNNFIIDLINDLVSGASVLESLNIEHYDIKPDNILLNWDGQGKPKFKLSDFGLVRSSVPGNIPTQAEIVTLTYRPPELLVNRPRNTIEPGKIDTWSIASTIYEYIRGEPLIRYYKGMTPLDVLNQIGLTDLIPSISDGTVRGRLFIDGYINMSFLPEIYQNLLKSMFNLNPNERPSAVLIRNALGLPFPTVYNIPEPTRKYNQSVTDLISCLNYEDNYIAFLISIEILTRLAGIYQYPSNPEYTAAAYHIGSAYIQDNPPNLITLGFKFGANPELIVTREKELLISLQFQVYNSNLTVPIRRLVHRFGDNRREIIDYLRGLNSAYYTNSLNDWFS